MPAIPEKIKQKAITHRKAVIASVILLVLVLLVSFVPTYIARYLVSSTLNDFGIEHEGIKTVRINLWKREVWAGPVRFRTGDTDHGVLGELGIKVNIFPVFKKHAMVERVLIRGIDIFVARSEDNTFTLNGIPLDQFRPAADTPGSQQPEKESTPWGTGLGEFEMQDSRLLFKRKTGGTLTVDIERFRLDDFTSWHPDDPGSFELKASVNNIELDLKGQARPFAEHITINVDADAREASLGKISEFTGPLNLERHGGVYNSTMQHEITLFDTGRLEGHSVGKVTLLGADYAQTDQFAIATEQADVGLDVRYSLSETGDTKVDGRLILDLVNASGKLPGDDPFSIGTAHAEFTELNVTQDADEDLTIAAKPKVEIKQLAYSGRVNLSMDAFMDVLRTLQSISARKEISKEETGLDKWSGDEVILPKSDITVNQINAAVSKLEMNTTNGKVTLDLALDNKATGVKVATTKRSTKIDAVHIKIDSLHLNSGEGKTGLALTGSNAVTGTHVKGPIGSGSIKTIELSQNIEMKINRGDIALQGSAKTGIDETRLQVHKTETLPEATVEVGKVSANIQKASFSITQQKLKWQVDSEASIDRALASYAKGKMSSAKIQRLEWSGAKADQNLNLATDTLTISGLEASTIRQFIDGIINSAPKEESASKDVKKDQETTTTAKKPKADDPDTFNVKLNRFELINGAKLRFLDQQVAPPIMVDLHIKKAEVHGIDSRNPESKAQANLEATINEFTHYKLQGNANNVGPKVNLELKSNLTNLELPPYSSYAAEFAGVHLQSGQLNTDLDVNANQGVLDGGVKLHIKDLEFTPLSEADAERISKKAGVPIETAVKLLKDPKGNIDLALPVSGTIGDPSVDISSAISKAVGNTLKAVMPHSIIGSVLSSISKGGEQTFKPILFKPGSSELNDEAKQYLDELVTLLKERPALSLHICGRATPEDFKEITLISLKLPADPKPELVEERQRLLKTHDPKLLELATERTRVVRRYLITDKGLKATQVGECRLKFNPDDTKPPRVAVTL